MRTIHKYTLDYGHTEIPLPCGAEVLTVQVQHDAICLWAAIDTEQAMSKTASFARAQRCWATRCFPFGKRSGGSRMFR